MSTAEIHTGRRLKNGEELLLPEKPEGRDFWGYSLIGYLSLTLEMNHAKKIEAVDGSYRRKLIIPKSTFRPAVMITNDYEKTKGVVWHRKDEFGLSELRHDATNKYEVALPPESDFEDPTPWLSISEIKVSGHGVQGSFPKPVVLYRDEPVKWPGALSFNDRVSEIFDEFQGLVS